MINKENIVFKLSLLILIYISIVYVNLLIGGGTTFLKSNTTYIYYTITEATFNGFLALLVSLFISSKINKKTIFVCFILGLMMSFFSLWETIHQNLNNFHLYPKFLINPESKEVPSSQYSRMIALLFVYIFYIVHLFFINKTEKLKLSFWLFFATGYFIFFSIGHIFMLKMYDTYREQERQHVQFLLKNYSKNSNICDYIKAECMIIKNDDINKIVFNLDLRNSLKKNIKTKERAKQFLLEDLTAFLKSNENHKTYVDTSLVIESLKYGFLKVDNEHVAILIDTKTLTRASDWYVNLMNTLNLLFLSLWSYIGFNIYKKHIKLQTPIK